MKICKDCKKDLKACICDSKSRFEKFRRGWEVLEGELWPAT